MSATATNTTANTQNVQPEAHQKPMVTYTDILQEALTKPGTLNAAYVAFHNYSLSNQILAAMQLAARGLPLAPIASFNGWKDKGRYVKKGEKAISLFMPVSVKRKPAKGEAAADEDEDGIFNVFMLRANWFSVDQTEGTDFAPEVESPAWDAATALAALGIVEEPFEMLSGNTQGYAKAGVIAISPLNPLKHKTRFHELAHNVLGHTLEATMTDSEHTPRDIREVEAESVAYILCTLLNLPGQAESRHYIQGWLAGQELPEKSAKKIFGAADRIMKAGQPAVLAIRQ
jgi:hypothetical protein